jgi:hypothetical protein
VDRALTDKERIGDLSVAEAIRHQAQDLEFAGCQADRFGGIRSTRRRRSRLKFTEGYRRGRSERQLSRGSRTLRPKEYDRSIECDRQRDSIRHGHVEHEDEKKERDRRHNAGEDIALHEASSPGIPSIRPSGGSANPTRRLSGWRTVSCGEVWANLCDALEHDAPFSVG